jgi:hypothetical protein
MMWKRAAGSASRKLGENPPLVGQNVVELFLIPEQAIQLALIGFDPFLVGQNLPLIGEDLPLIGSRRV